MPLDPAEILVFSDWVVTQLQTNFSVEYPAAEIIRAYEVEYDLGTFTGLKVNVFPAEYLIDSPATRSEDNFDVAVAIVVMDRWTQPGRYTRQWMDERVNIVQHHVFDPLNVIAEPVTGYWSQNVHVTSVFDIKLLRQHKVFWSEIEVVFRKLR